MCCVSWAKVATLIVCVGTWLFLYPEVQFVSPSLDSGLAVDFDRWRKLSWLPKPHWSKEVIAATSDPWRDSRRANLQLAGCSVPSYCALRCFEVAAPTDSKADYGRTHNESHSQVKQQLPASLVPLGSCLHLNPEHVGILAGPPYGVTFWKRSPKAWGRSRPRRRDFSSWGITFPSWAASTAKERTPQQTFWHAWNLHLFQEAREMKSQSIPWLPYVAWRKQCIPLHFMN